MTVQVQTVLTSPLRRAQATAQTVSKLQSLAGSPQPKVQVMEELTNRYLGGWEGRHALEVWATKHFKTLCAVIPAGRVAWHY